MTIQPNPSTVKHFDGMTNFKFQNPDLDEPLVSGVFNRINYVTGPIKKYGPADQGAGFDFSFNDSPLLPGKDITFNMYLGAASNQADAEKALRDVKAEVYALLNPASNGQCVDNPTNTRSVFVMAFNGVGGNPI